MLKELKTTGGVTTETTVPYPGDAAQRGRAQHFAGDAAAGKRGL